PPTLISTLSLHDALPISDLRPLRRVPRRTTEFRGGPGEILHPARFFACANHAESGQVSGRISAWIFLRQYVGAVAQKERRADQPDRKSTRLNSSHVAISY